MMVKLASAREFRTYGSRLGRDRAEYVNAGLYVFSAVVLTCGFAAAGFSMEPISGLVLLLIALALIAIVNVHDLVAHLAGIDYRLRLVEYDMQLALVELAVPVVHMAGSVVFFLGILFVFNQTRKKYGYSSLEKHGMNMLIAGPALWLIGSIHDSCQIYERADGRVQIMQQTVQIPFLMGSLLLIMAAILNAREKVRFSRHGLDVLGTTWVWLGIAGGLLLFIGGIMNVVKVFNMQQIRGLRLEKLRGGAQERLLREREGQFPLITEEQRVRGRGGEVDQFPLIAEEQRVRSTSGEMRPSTPPAGPTPYKDVLVGQS